MILDNPLYCISRSSSPFCSLLNEAPFGAPGFSFAKWEQLCHAKFAACELRAEHLADTTSSRNVNDWNKPSRKVLRMNLFDTVVQLLKFFTPHSLSHGCCKRDDHVESWRLVWKSRSSAFSAKAEIPFLTSLLISQVSLPKYYSGISISSLAPIEGGNVLHCVSVSQVTDHV